MTVIYLESFKNLQTKPGSTDSKKVPDKTEVYIDVGEQFLHLDSIKYDPKLNCVKIRPREDSLELMYLLHPRPKKWWEFWK